MDIGYLFDTTPPAPPGLFVALPVAFAVLLLLSVLAYWRRARLAPENPVLRRLIRRVAKAGMWIAGIGIALVAVRYAQIDYLEAPVLIVLLFLATIAVVAYFVYDLSERYPLAVWKLQESHVERRYRPPPKPRREPQRARPPVRGKRGKR
jgi:Na+/glutamate symporter